VNAGAKVQNKSKIFLGGWAYVIRLKINNLELRFGQCSTFIIQPINVNFQTRRRVLFFFDHGVAVHSLRYIDIAVGNDTSWYSLLFGRNIDFFFSAMDSDSDDEKESLELSIVILDVDDEIQHGSVIIK
jgi:hypothetical protein